MAESSVVVPAAELDRLIYVAIAGARDDAETDLLAGLARHVVERQPDVSAAELTSAIVELRDAIVAHRPAREADLARNTSLLMSRLDISETGEPEPPEVFAPTLLRLRLLTP